MRIYKSPSEKEVKNYEASYKETDSESGRTFEITNKYTGPKKDGGDSKPKKNAVAGGNTNLLLWSVLAFVGLFGFTFFGLRLRRKRS